MIVALALVVAGGIAVAIVGNDQAKFAKVNVLADELHLHAIGPIDHEYRYGGGLAGPTTYEAFIGGPDAYDRLVSALEKAGYRHVSGNAWTRLGGPGEPLATADELSAGQSFTDPDDHSVVVHSDGVVVTLTR
ncbi:hypothetical protein GCM10009617_08270 [Leifsonia poae]|uniref:Uncharacterized protein n=1 Tax=Leifsonia poae TaxID=110933 RepID=A0A9W6H7Z8_9MICO|nr:hypothetical protein GCM10017584_09260 [Leifsonia poae]